MYMTTLMTSTDNCMSAVMGMLFVRYVEFMFTIEKGHTVDKKR